MLSEKTIRNNLSRLIEEHNTNGHQLAITARVHYSRVANVLIGKTTYPPIDLLFALAKVFGVTVDDLCKDTSEVNSGEVVNG